MIDDMPDRPTEPDDDTGDSRPSGVGGNIRRGRKLAGETQSSLALKMNYSVSMVGQVERGEVPASPGFVARAAHVLGLSTHELYQQPSPRFGAELAGLTELENAIMGGRYLATDDPATPLDALEDRVRRVSRLQQQSRYDISSIEIPALLTDLHTTAEDTTGQRNSELVHTLLTAAYESAVICLHRLGSPVSHQAAERAAWAARHSGDPLLAALADGEVSLPLMNRGAYRLAQRVADQAQASIAQYTDSPAAYTVRGYLHLRSAILAARQGNRAESDMHLDEARDWARRLPDDADIYDTAFCEPNVIIHRVAAAVEMNDGTTALGRDEPLPASTMTSRLAHHRVDISRAYQLHGDRHRALDSLYEARSLAPQLTRYHPQVHETVATLADSQLRGSERLASFARWAGIRI